MSHHVTTLPMAGFYQQLREHFFAGPTNQLRQALREGFDAAEKIQVVNWAVTPLGPAVQDTRWLAMTYEHEAAIYVHVTANGEVVSWQTTPPLQEVSLPQRRRA